MQEMSTDELLNQLMKKSAWEIDNALLNLLIAGKIGFIQLSRLYATSLENLNKDRLAQLMEAELCAADMLVNSNKSEKESYRKAVQRTLYMMHKSNRFNMTDIDKNYGYEGDDKAKQYSWYERTKANREI